MRMREVRSCGNVLYQRRRHSQRCQLVDIGASSYLGLSSTCLNREKDVAAPHLIALQIHRPPVILRISAHFGGVTRCGSASLGRVGTGGGGRAGPYIQEYLVANVNLHIRPFLAVAEVNCYFF